MFKLNRCILRVSYEGTMQARRMYPTTRWLSYFLILVSGFMTSCTIDAQYSPKNPVNIPSAWNSTDRLYANKEIKLACVAWWRQYHDTDLNHLIKLGLRYNNDVNIAIANIDAAQGELKRVKLNWIPSLESVLGYTSFPYAGFPGVLVTAGPSYTLNIFRQIKEQQKAHYELKATKAMRDAVRLAVISEISSGYFSYLAEVEQLRLLRQVKQDLFESVAIYKDTYQSGLTTEISLSRAQSELDLIKAEETIIKNNIIKTQNTLRYLINENPAEFHFTHTFRQVDSHHVLVGSLPLSVIENRPDMIAAMNELKATNAGIGLAISNFLPTVQLSAMRGDIGTVPNGTTLGTPIYFNQAIVQQPLLTLTSLGTLDELRGINKAAYFKYIKTLRRVLHDVNNDLAAHDFYTQRLDLTIDAKQKIGIVYQLNRDLYQQGIISYLSFLEEKIKFDKIKILVNQHKLEQTLTIVHLYHNLAMGYKRS